MSKIDRRLFMQVSGGVLGASAVHSSKASPAVTASARLPARIYTLFFDIAPARDDIESIEPMTNAEIVARLERECEGVEFVVRDLTQTGADRPTLASVLNEMKGLRREGYDGVLICGWPRDYDVLRTGLPTINVAVVNDFMNVPYPLFEENRVIGGLIDPWRFSSDPQVIDRMFRDLADQVKLIRALKQMKTEHILTVTDSRFVNVIYGDMLKDPPPDYNETILGAIEGTFGTRVTKIGSREVTEDEDIRRLWHNESREANEIAQRWMENAQEITCTIPSEVVRSAKVYLAMRILMEKYGATSITFHIRTLIPNPRPEDQVFPALATSEFQLRNEVGKCQSHLNIILSEMLLQYAYGRPSMMGDYMVDIYNNTSSVQHCEGPWNPWGDERRVPYILTDHRERRVRGRRTTGGGAASWVLYPPNEPVTMWQVDVPSREILMHTGTTVHMRSGPAEYRGHFWEMM